MFYCQSNFKIRFEWGLAGIQLVAKDADVTVIVDTLSFSTCVDVAVARGASVFPCRWKDERAAEFAMQCSAELAVWRGQPGRFSLSPATMLNAVEGTRIVLPSPNGSELTLAAGSLGKTVIAGCLRNCRSVAEHVSAIGKSVAVIACGERWPDRTLRPAVEDLVAAGAIISNLSGTTSPEARTAIAAWESAKNDLGAFLKACASGVELIERKFENDVEMAGEVDVSTAIPIFHERAYTRLMA